MADTAFKETTRRTNLEMPVELAERIEAQGKIDRRNFKPELLVLLEEAVTAREKRKP